MKRNSLLLLLESYQATAGKEYKICKETIEFVKENPDCFERTLQAGHITASGWVLSSDKSAVLMMHHRKLNRWFQPGGHCDGDPDVEHVSRKEVWEETGIKHLELVQNGIFDIDIHLIPESNGFPAHNHYDIRFLFQAKPEQGIVVNNESNDVTWVPITDVENYNSSESIMRMVRKTTALEISTSVADHRL